MATEIRSLIDEGIAKLARVSGSARLDAELLLAAALGVSRSSLNARADEPVVDCEATDRYEAWLTRRSHGEPVAYILGRREFWSLDLEITPDVLVPRPESELLVERALSCLTRESDTPAPARVLDLGSGSGAIALAIAHERPWCEVIGVDASRGACELARRNAARLGLGNVSFLVGDWYAPVAGQRFDVIVSNPPYVAEGDPRLERAVDRYEPHLALYAGADGLEALERIVAGAPAHLVPGGWLLVEHGDRQASPVRDAMTAAGLTAIGTARDLAGLERCSFAMMRHDARGA